MSEHKVREKSLEERKELLLKEVQENIDNVILRSEIVFGAVSTGDGQYGIQSGAYPASLVKMACFDLQFRASMMFQHMEMMKAMQQEQEKKIITRN